MSNLKSEIRPRRAEMQAKPKSWLDATALGACLLQSSHLPTFPSSHRREARRGALLLVCLSLLVLFVVVALTFMLITNQYRKTLVPDGKIERYGDDYKTQLDD